MECSDLRERCVERQASGAVGVRPGQVKTSWELEQEALGGSSFFHRMPVYLTATEIWKESSSLLWIFGQEQGIIPMGATAGGLTFYL